MIIIIDSREEWLKSRQKQGIGGSEAGAVIGVNKYQTNVDLWKMKTGKREAADLSDNAAAQFGKAAEQHIRELFKLEYPEYIVEYHEFDMYVNDKYPFIFATLDGDLTAPDGSKGILEIKTTLIKNSSQWDEWTDRIPDSYYAQCLHQLAATGYDFVILYAYIRYYDADGKIRVSIRPYMIYRKDVLSDIDYLIAAEAKFWKSVQDNKCPALILPNI